MRAFSGIKLLASVNRQLDLNQTMLYQNYNKYIHIKDKLDETVKMYGDSQCEKPDATQLFDKLLEPLRLTFILRIRKGLTEVDWTSTRLDQFAQYFSNQLARYQRILTDVNEQAEPLICDKIR